MLIVDVKATGSVITRNGEFKISSVRLELSKDESSVKMGFVSGRLKRDLHTGTTIDAKAMDELAERWLKARGLLPKDKDHSGIDKALVDLAGATKLITAATKVLGGKVEVATH